MSPSSNAPTFENIPVPKMAPERSLPEVSPLPVPVPDSVVDPFTDEKASLRKIPAQRASYMRERPYGQTYDPQANGLRASPVQTASLSKPLPRGASARISDSSSSTLPAKTVEPLSEVERYFLGKAQQQREPTLPNSENGVVTASGVTNSRSQNSVTTTKHSVLESESAKTSSSRIRNPLRNEN